MSTWNKAVHSAARMLTHSPGCRLVAMLALAVAIGANTTIFSVVYSSLLPSLPFRDTGLILVTGNSAPAGRNAVSAANYPDWKSPNRVFGDTAAMVDMFRMNLTGVGDPKVLAAGAVTSNFFRMIGVQPIIGRAFVAGEDTRGYDHVAILSHTLWRTRFGSDAGIVSQRITLNGEVYRVIGVLPRDFEWNGSQADVWIPYASAEGGYCMSAAILPVRCPVETRG